MTSPIKQYRHSYYPKGDVSQWFGENIALYKNLNIGLEKGHNGVDIIAPWGTPIYAVERGLVVDVKNDPNGYGKHLRILSMDGIGEGREWTYGHASENLVKVGDVVEQGQMIQKMGNTGFVVSGPTPYWKYNPFAGTHLHLGLRLFVLDGNGWQYTSTSPKIRILNYDNGFLGSVDPEPRLKEAALSDIEIGIKNVHLTLQSIINAVNNLFSKK